MKIVAYPLVGPPEVLARDVPQWIAYQMARAASKYTGDALVRVQEDESAIEGGET
jgi:hypothetical protein